MNKDCSCSQHGDLRLSGPPTGQGASGGARTFNIRVPADLRADSLFTVPPTPPYYSEGFQHISMVDSFPGPALEAGNEERWEGGSIEESEGKANLVLTAHVTSVISWPDQSGRLEENVFRRHFFSVVATLPINYISPDPWHSANHLYRRGYGPSVRRQSEWGEPENLCMECELFYFKLLKEEEKEKFLKVLNYSIVVEDGGALKELH
ncbi:hypothetical protein PoB_003360200 [Plakobranchus ocellatus]|uniref:Uncharacterized protein n=1 Tax=Plakobranchus ocellatus TaxID=259542 RepID=A0AAV4AJC4_9GAST|nr:hypothetical protein PoB_003360200 [Plakobranchus ocellatus]